MIAVLNTKPRFRQRSKRGIGFLADAKSTRLSPHNRIAFPLLGATQAQPGHKEFDHA